MAIVKKKISQLPQLDHNLTGETLFEIEDKYGSYQVSLSDLEDYFFFVPAKVTISASPSYIRVGSTAGITVNCGIVPGSVTSFPTRELYKNSVKVADYTTTSFTYSDTLTPITVGNTNYRTIVDADNQGEIVNLTASTNVAAVYPIMWIASNNDYTGSTVYTVATKIDRPQENTNITVASTGVYLYFLYDASYPDLVAILDPNGFNIISGFTKSTVDVVSTGLTNNWTKSYKMYKYSTISNFNGQHKFLFSV